MERKIGKLILHSISPKLIAIGLLICYLISLIPLIMLSWFNYPSADDYNNGSLCYHVWESGHSILSVAASALKRTIEEWFEWRGCFTSSFLSAIPPHIFGIEWYKITTWLILGMLTVSLVYLFYMILVRVFNADVWNFLSITMLSLLISVQCVPGRVEVFYWYSGAINYTFMYGVSLLFYGFIIKLIINKGKSKKIDLITASVLGFLVSGGNQMTMLNAAILLFLLIILITYRNSWSEYKILGIPLAVFYAGFLLSVVAPGNFVRAKTAVGMNPLKAIAVSFYYCLNLVINEWITWPVIAAVIAMVPLFWHISGKSKYHFPCPLAVVLFGYCLVSAMITPPLFAVGNIMAGRLQGEIYLMFVLVLVLCVAYVTGWANKKYKCIKDITQTEKENNRYGLETKICLLGSLLFLMFGTLITVIPNPDFFTASAAAYDYINGSAQNYGNALKTRITLYEENRGRSIEVEPLKEAPKLLFFSDITENAEDWQNQGVARFYGLDGVVLKTE